jgi:hypothetical protein
MVPSRIKSRDPNDARPAAVRRGHDHPSGTAPSAKRPCLSPHHCGQASAPWRPLLCFCGACAVCGRMARYRVSLCCSTSRKSMFEIAKSHEKALLCRRYAPTGSENAVAIKDSTAACPVAEGSTAKMLERFVQGSVAIHCLSPAERNLARQSAENASRRRAETGSTHARMPFVRLMGPLPLAISSRSDQVQASLWVATAVNVCVGCGCYPPPGSRHGLESSEMDVNSQCGFRPAFKLPRFDKRGNCSDVGCIIHYVYSRPWGCRHSSAPSSR